MTVATAPRVPVFTYVDDEGSLNPMYKEDGLEDWMKPATVPSDVFDVAEPAIWEALEKADRGRGLTFEEVLAVVRGVTLAKPTPAQDPLGTDPSAVVAMLGGRRVHRLYRIQIAEIVNNTKSEEPRINKGVSDIICAQEIHKEDEIVFKIEKTNEYGLTDFLVYNKYMKMNLPDMEIAVAEQAVTNSVDMRRVLWFRPTGMLKPALF